MGHFGSEAITGRASPGTRAAGLFMYDLGASLPTAVAGDRCWIQDADGTRWLDATSGAGAVTIGYGVAEVMEAIAEQARRLPYAYSRRFFTEPQLELARSLQELAPWIGLSYFCSGGSEANESALKIARLYFLERGTTTKHKVLTRAPSYHGNTLSTLSLSGRPTWSAPFKPMLSGGAQLPAPNRLRPPKGITDAEFGAIAAQEVEDAILREGPASVAALLVEPIVGGTAPALAPPDNYWALVRAICDKHDVLLIADEVLSGFGRTGELFAMDHWGVVPDIAAVAKGLSGGYAPLGAALVSHKVAAAFQTGTRQLRHSFTFSGHALACAAGVASLRYMQSRGLVDRARSLGANMLSSATALSRHAVVAEVRGYGMLVGIEFHGINRRGGGRISDLVVRRASESHVMVAASPEGDQLQLMPPLTTNPDELEHIVGTVDACLTELTA